MAQRHSLTRRFSSPVQPDGTSLVKLAGYVDAGLIKPVIGKTFDSLDNALEAFQLLETGHAKGKIVVKVAGEPASE